jgi:enamine deaminase RidA (YjgF/YER057c/UK114 family)
MIEYNRKANVFVAGRAASERHEVLAQGRDRDQQTREALGHVRALQGGPLHEQMEAALLCYAGVSSASRSVWDAIHEAAAHARWALVQELRALRREASRG